MKAGTTWMQHVLAEHPEIYFTPEKEIHYFAQAYIPGEMPLATRNRLTRASSYIGIDPRHNTPAGVRARLLWTANYLAEPVDDLWYANLFTFRPSGAFCADFSNLYAHVEKPGWDRIRDMTETLRVIYTMRDPIKRLWSHAKFHAQFVGQAEQIWNWTPESVEAFVRRDFIWKNGEYGAAVRRLRGALPKDELRVYFFENIHRDQRGWLRDIEGFLGIAHQDYSDALLGTRVNESVDAPMPEWFAGLFKADVERIIAELREEGLEAPSSWMKSFGSKAA